MNTASEPSFPPDSAQALPPNKALITLGACLPLLSPIVGCLAVVSWAGSDFTEGWRTIAHESGLALVVCGVAILSAIAIPVLLLLTGSGRPVPSFFTALFALLPWLVGLAVTHYALYEAKQALLHVEAAMRGALFSAGVSQALIARGLGAGMSAALLASAGMGSAVAAFAMRTPGRRIAGAAVGASTALLLLVASALAWRAGPMAVGLLVLFSAGAILTSGLGGAAVGFELRGYPSSRLALSGTLFASLGFAAGAVGTEVSGAMAAFHALAYTDPSARPAMLEAAMTQLSWVSWLARLGPALALAAALGVFGWSATRDRPGPRRILGGVAVLALVAVVASLDAWTFATMTSDTARLFEGGPE